MADEDPVEGESGGGSGKKFDLGSLKIKLQNLDFKDRKVQGGLGAVALLLIILIYFLFSGKEEQMIVSTGDSDEKFVLEFIRPAAYINLSGADPKDTELRATIKDDDKVMNFSISLGLEQKALKLEVLKRMSPLVSELLRYLSTMSKDQILEMIQDPKQVEKRKMMAQLNYTLQISGEERLDLNSSGRIVSINFVKFYFPGI